MLNRRLLCVLCIAALMISGCGGSGNSGSIIGIDEKTDDNSKETDENEKNEEEASVENPDEYLIDVDNKGRADVIKAEYTVTRGTFEKREFNIGNIMYTDLYYETLDMSSGAIVKKLKVKEGDKIRKGDVILTYDILDDEIEIKRKTLEVEQQEKEYTAGLDARKAEIKTAENELRSITDKNKREIKELEIKKLKLGLEKYQKTGKTVAEEKAELNKMKQDNTSNKIIAKHDGYVLSLYVVNDQELSGNQTVAVISGKKDYYVEIDDVNNDDVRYGDKVEIVVEGRKGEKNISVEGEVFSASNILNPRSNLHRASVKILDEPEGVDWDNPIKVYYNSVCVENALMVPVKAVLHEETDGSGEEEAAYVYIKNGDTVTKQYLDIIDQNNDYVRVNDGVSEGDTLIIYNHS